MTDAQDVIDGLESVQTAYQFNGYVHFATSLTVAICLLGIFFAVSLVRFFIKSRATLSHRLVDKWLSDVATHATMGVIALTTMLEAWTPATISHLVTMRLIATSVATVALYRLHKHCVRLRNDVERDQ